jgi:hypothetical protein
MPQPSLLRAIATSLPRSDSHLTMQINSITINILSRRPIWRLHGHMASTAKTNTPLGKKRKNFGNKKYIFAKN